VISNLIGKLGRPIGDLFADAQRKTSAKVYNNSFDTKVSCRYNLDIDMSRVMTKPT
jgi:hypothetical protein